MKVTVVLSRDSKLIYESLECFPVDVMVMCKSINVSKHIYIYMCVHIHLLKRLCCSSSIHVSTPGSPV